MTASVDVLLSTATKKLTVWWPFQIKIDSAGLNCREEGTAPKG